MIIQYLSISVHALKFSSGTVADRTASPKFFFGVAAGRLCA